MRTMLHQMSVNQSVSNFLIASGVAVFGLGASLLSYAMFESLSEDVKKDTFRKIQAASGFGAAGTTLMCVGLTIKLVTN